MPFRVTMICLGCSSTGRDRIKAATSSAVFHLASYRQTAGLEKYPPAPQQCLHVSGNQRDANQIIKIQLEFLACSQSMTRPSISSLLITEGSSHSWSSVTSEYSQVQRDLWHKEHRTVTQALLDNVGSLHLRPPKSLRQQCLSSSTFISHAPACLTTCSKLMKREEDEDVFCSRECPK